MGDKSMTTVSIEQHARDRLDDYRHEKHGTMTDVVTALLEMVPPVEEMHEGCANCGTEPIESIPMEEQGGVIRWFSHELDGTTIYHSNYFCSAECVAELDEEIERHVPREPDRIEVGGKSEMRAAFSDATFHIEGQQQEVGIPIPGAFAGEDSHGGEYDYVGEPVYIWHEGDYRQQGVIEDIIHEETHTALILGHDRETVMLNHPDEERRREYAAQHEKWTTADCGACGTELHFMVNDPPDVCPKCGAEEW